MNRELRRLQEREERRSKKEGRGRRAQVATRPEKKERVGFRQFLREVRQELNKVAWPDRQTLVTYTLVSVITTAALTAYTSGLDFAFSTAFMEWLLG